MNIFYFYNVNNFSQLYNKYHLNIKGNLLYLFTNMVKTLKEAHATTRLSKLYRKRKRDNE